jgi:hypothetical protein
LFPASVRPSGTAGFVVVVGEAGVLASDFVPLLSAGLVVVAVVGVLELWAVLLPVGLAANRGMQTAIVPAQRQMRGVVVLFMVLLEVKKVYCLRK